MFRKITQQLQSLKDWHYISFDTVNLQTLYGNNDYKTMPCFSYDTVSPPTGIDPDTYATAKQAAPGWDIYHLEDEWRTWIKEPPRNPDLAFIGFCKKWFEKRGRP